MNKSCFVFFKLWKITAVVFSFLSFFTSSAFGLVSKAKVAELASHRIDRLVTLSKIDAAFLNRLGKLEVSVLENQSPSYYRVIATQSAAGNEKVNQLNLVFDQEGKPLSFQVIDGVVGLDLQWPDKDAATLTENCLHFVLENIAQEKVKLFEQGLINIELNKVMKNNEVMAQGIITSALSAQKLIVYLKVDGTLVSTEFIN